MVIVLKQNPDGNKVEQLMKRLRGMGLDLSLIHISVTMAINVTPTVTGTPCKATKKQMCIRDSFYGLF